jgi:hypothetical protein
MVEEVDPNIIELNWSHPTVIAHNFDRLWC